MQYPDLIGLTLKESIPLLESNGVAYKVTHYQPPRDKVENVDHERLRVVRIKNTSENEIELVVCRI